MKRKTIDELYDLMRTVEEEIGESCIEYAGYGYMKDFENFLYNFFKDVKRKNLDITNIWSFFDVIEEFHEEIYGNYNSKDDSYQIELEIVARFLVSDYCNDECYNDFIKEISSYL